MSLDVETCGPCPDTSTYRKGLNPSRNWFKQNVRRHRPYSGGGMGIRGPQWDNTRVEIAIYIYSYSYLYLNRTKTEPN